MAGSQSADPAAAFNDGQPGLVRAGDSRDPHAHLYDKGITAGSDHAVVVADLILSADYFAALNAAALARYPAQIARFCARLHQRHSAHRFR